MPKAAKAKKLTKEEAAKVDTAWPSKAREEARKMNEKARKAVMKLKKSNKQNYHPPKPPKMKLRKTGAARGR